MPTLYRRSFPLDSVRPYFEEILAPVVEALRRDCSVVDGVLLARGIQVWELPLRRLACTAARLGMSPGHAAEVIHDILDGAVGIEALRAALSREMRHCTGV